MAEESMDMRLAKTSGDAEGIEVREPSDVLLAPIVVGTASPVFEPRQIDRERYLGAYLRPAVVADGWTSERLSVRAASVRGLSHQWYGSPRQDDYVLSVTDAGWLVAGVADGVSAAEQSHMASSEVLQYLVRWFAATRPRDLGSVDWQALLEALRWDLVEKERALCPGVESPGLELATTIAFAVVAPTDDGRADVVAVGVGDSGCWVLDDTGFDRVLGGKSLGEDGISDSTVAALPLLPERVVPVSVTLERGQVLLLATDGVGDPLGNGSGEVGRLLSDALLRRELPSPLAFARVADFSRETYDDDRTLVAVRLAGFGVEEEPSGEAAGSADETLTSAQDADAGQAIERPDDETGQVDGREAEAAEREG